MKIDKRVVLAKEIMDLCEKHNLSFIDTSFVLKCVFEAVIEAHYLRGAENDS